MRKRFPTVIVLLLFPLTCYGQEEVPLESEGKFKVVEVDKTKIITINYKEKVTVVDELPYRLKATSGAIYYDWSYPNTITAIKKGPVLEIINAPKGTHVVYVNMAFVDFKEQKIISKFGQSTFTIGELPGPGPTPPPPPPGPSPNPELVTMLKEAYKLDGVNIDKMNKFVSIAASIAKACKDDSSIKTVGEVSARWKNDLITNITPDLLNVRKAQATWLSKQFPSQPAMILDDKLRQQFHDTFMTLSVSLGEVMK